MICTKLNGTSKIICSDKIEGVQLCPEGAEACNTILANTELKTDTPDFSKTSCASGCGEATNGLYKEETSKGTTYYFRGTVDNNWVKFANKYWRIIRINEDGSLRIIYQGTSANTTGTGTQIGESEFNNSLTDNAYLGYMYGNAGSSTYEETHANTNDSTIKGVLDTWYQDNLSSYASSIDGNAGFCGDRTPSTSRSSTNNQGGIGTTLTYYGGYIRLSTNKQPTFECLSGDLYTTSGSEDGNRTLTYPIGLISMDEVWYAGGYQSSNGGYYLYTGQNYWTMSPFWFSGGGAWVSGVNAIGFLSSSFVDNAWGVRPVINLRSDVTISGGDGTSSNPYVVQTD